MSTSPALLDNPTEEIAQQTTTPLPKSAPPKKRVKARHYPQTDAGNAELFADLNWSYLRYDHRRKKWLRWSGHTWVLDTDKFVFRRAKDAARHRLKTSASIEDDKDRRYEAAWAFDSEQTRSITACLAQATATEALADTGEGWNSDPYLFAVKNGVVDLRTGRLRAGKQTDRITMKSPVEFDSSALCPRWEQFLREVFKGDAELIQYVQYAVGYCLSGDTSEQCLFLAHGDGSNGKTTFLNILGQIIGEYSHNLPFSSFEIKNRSVIPNDVAAIVGKRFVTSVETGEAQRLNEARIKALTGGDPISARYLNAEFFTFRPVAKFWLAFNHKPQVRDDSFGFWRRIHFLPFTQTFDGASKDRQLEQKLRAEAPGILNWAIRGCLGWQKHGLHMPATMKQATQRYQEESDILAEFFEDRCVIEAGAWDSTADIFAAYSGWAKERVEKYPLERGAFAGRLAKLPGLLPKKFGKDGTRGWSGIRLKTAASTGTGCPPSGS
jgi:putative DNA primase/helicase